jgi:hypothetical protein
VRAAAVFAVAGLLAAGCGGDDDDSDGAATDTPATENDGDTGVDLTMWTRSATQEQSEQLVDAYNESHENQVALTVIANDNYNQQVASAAGADELPDIFAADVVFVPNFMQQGLFLDITEPRKARRYLLTGGIEICGVCRHPLIGSNKWRRKLNERGERDPWPYYFCHPKVGGKACVGTKAEPLERHVRDELLARIDSDPEFVEQLTVDDHAAEREQVLRELTALDERRAELSRLWALGERSSEEWGAAREVLDEQQARLNIRLADLPAPAEHAVDLSALPAAWPNMTLDERRQALRFVRTRVTLYPSGTHGKALDRRVTVEFLVEDTAPAALVWRLPLNLPRREVLALPP